MPRERPTCMHGYPTRAEDAGTNGWLIDRAPGCPLCKGNAGIPYKPPPPPSQEETSQIGLLLPPQESDDDLVGVDSDDEEGGPRGPGA